MNQELNKIIQELYTCLPNDRNRFNLIMENLKDKFLSSPSNPNINYNYKFSKEKFSSQIMNEKSINQNINIPNIKNNINIQNNFLNNNTDVNSSLNPLKVISNCQPIDLPTLNVQNKLYDANNEDIGEYINLNNNYNSETFNENIYENKIRNDVHANCKYYYPEEYNSQVNENKFQNIDWKNNLINNNINSNYGGKNYDYKKKNEF